MQGPLLTSPVKVSFKARNYMKHSNGSYGALVDETNSSAGSLNRLGNGDNNSTMHSIHPALAHASKVSANKLIKFHERFKDKLQMVSKDAQFGFGSNVAGNPIEKVKPDALENNDGVRCNLSMSPVSMRSLHQKLSKLNALGNNQPSS